MYLYVHMYIHMYVNVKACEFKSGYDVYYKRYKISFPSNQVNKNFLTQVQNFTPGKKCQD
jgi:hypothetical protein